MAEIPKHHVPEENNTKSEKTGIQEDVPYLALDIGGSLIKLVYFSRHEQSPAENQDSTNMIKALEHRSHHVHGVWLHFVKFETRDINQCLDFIKFKQLHCQVVLTRTDIERKQKGIAAKIKVTWAGAYKFADLFMEKIGVTVEKEDGMDCLAVGANFLLKVIQNEAFTFIKGKKESVDIDKNDLFPYIFVNIGSGVSIHKVAGDGNSELVDVTRIGGITCWGLGRWLTKCKSKCGNIKRIDLFLEDTFSMMNIGSFGKTISENKTLEDCNAEDISLSLLEMISHNIAQIASLNACIYGIKRIFFGGSFIKDNTCASKSKGTAKAMFLGHEGFVGALGALMSYENKHGLLIMDESQDVETTLKSTSSCHDPLWNFRG
ncbi:hypothetical protein MKW98_032446 [Papaver atlanticum]|uniref:Pantothenate kinase n=1 Tax=Papaver atlanticum TaxID=357466 RepID=A0AAD4SXA3_9MAGN|nr:hypothetical protein MKW98_032446 [Papaver atlanticum]